VAEAEAAFLRGKGHILLDVMVNTTYVHPINFLAPGSRDMFDANNKAVHYLFHALCQSEFDRVHIEDLACRISEQLKDARAGNAQIQAWMYATYRREYENFTHLHGEFVDALFQRFMVDALKLLHSLDRTLWDGKVEAILESEKYDTLTVNELFS
jgi:hypothetical protein